MFQAAIQLLTHLHPIQDFTEWWLRMVVAQFTAIPHQISTAADFGLSFSSNNAPSVLCTGENFDFTETSGSIRGSLFGGSKEIRYTWQSQEPGYFTSSTINPYGETHRVFFGLFTYYDGTANFTVNNNSNAPVTKNLVITPNVLNDDQSVYCSLSSEVIPVTINPIPVITNTATSICSGNTFNVSPVNGAPASNIVPSNTKYSWSKPTVEWHNRNSFRKWAKFNFRNIDEYYQ